jgi:hypothetical protein
MKHLMSNDPRHEISRSTDGHFKRRHKRSPHRFRDVPLPLHCQHRQCSLHIPLWLLLTDDLLSHMVKETNRYAIAGLPVGPFLRV